MSVPGGDKGGGDASAMLEYGDKALDLQKQIYNEQKDNQKPWYNTGTAAVGQLANLLGLEGGQAGAKTRDQIGMDTALKYLPGGSYLGEKSGQYFGDGQFADGEGNVYNVDTKTGDIFKRTAGVTGSVFWKNDPNLMGAIDAEYNGQQKSADYGSLNKAFSMNDYQEDPGYQFRLAEGNKALERKLNASGKTYSPEAAKALIGYNSDMGSQEYNNAYNRFNINQDNVFNRLATLSGFGQTASGQIANAGTNYANSATDLYTGMGNAVTAANQAKAQNNGSMFKSLLGAGAQVGSAYLMSGSDSRIKHDIKAFDEKNGHKRYTFRYNSDPDTVHIGVMAQDLLKTIPEAVHTGKDGFYMVDYSKLGFPMETL